MMTPPLIKNFRKLDNFYIRVQLALAKRNSKCNLTCSRYDVAAAAASARRTRCDGPGGAAQVSCGAECGCGCWWLGREAGRETLPKASPSPHLAPPLPSPLPTYPHTPVRSTHFFSIFIIPPLAPSGLLGRSAGRATRVSAGPHGLPDTPPHPPLRPFGSGLRRGPRRPSCCCCRCCFCYRCSRCCGGSDDGGACVQSWAAQKGSGEGEGAGGGGKGTCENVEGGGEGSGRGGGGSREFRGADVGVCNKMRGGEN
jgi:hypothetical protein